MKNFETIIDETYEFFDELIGSIIPGIYFCSYFVFSAFAISYTLTGNFEIFKGHKYIAVSIIVIAYIIGTMCRRSNSREPDNISARHIYFNSIPRDDNDFAFARLIKNDDFDKMIDSLKKKTDEKEINIKLDEDILNRRKKYSLKQKVKIKCKKFILFSQNNGRKYNENILSKPEVQRYIYQKLLARKEELNNNSVENKEEIECIDNFIKDNELEDYCEVYVDYPYSNLKDYLENRELNELAKYATWDSTNSEKTSRSKSVICNMKLYIKHVSPHDYGQLQKTEAHIRFMNSMWYVNKIISTLSFIILSVALITLSLYFLIYNFPILSFIKSHMSQSMISFYNSIRLMIENLINSAFKTQFQWKDWKNSFGPLLLTIIISFGYRCISRLIITTVKNNFHYQRIREVVSVIYIYNLLLKDKTQEEQNIINQTIMGNSKNKEISLSIKHK